MKMFTQWCAFAALGTFAAATAVYVFRDPAMQLPGYSWKVNYTPQPRQITGPTPEQIILNSGLDLDTQMELPLSD